jgi:hypothetical protein
MPDESKSKKITIDEDWKSQVEAEREAAKHQQDAAATGGASTAEDETQAGHIPWPEPSLALLITTLATQAMAAMGLMAYVGGEQSTVDLEQAKHFVDTIGLLEEKTRGNATGEETALFENVLHELRMAYLAVQERPAGPSA